MELKEEFLIEYDEWWVEGSKESISLLKVYGGFSCRNFYIKKWFAKVFLFRIGFLVVADLAVSSAK